MNEIEIERQKRETKKRNIRRHHNRLMDAFEAEIEQEKMNENKFLRGIANAKKAGDRLSISDIEAVKRSALYEKAEKNKTGDRLSISDIEAAEGMKFGGYAKTPAGVSDIMGSPISVQVGDEEDNVTLTNPTAAKYYKDIL